MRRHSLPVLALAAMFLLAPLGHAFAQADPGGDSSAAGGGDDDTAKKKKSSEWDDKQAPLPGLRNAGPCPFVKVLYDAARYTEFQGDQVSAGAVGYTGEIEGLSAGCSYRGAEPIHMEMEILFELGKGPAARDASKDYRYWVAVTDRNRSVLAKQYFSLPVKFPAGQDRITVSDKVSTITIPRGDDKVSGANFEVLVGFDVTPQMAAFNRDGKRFRANAGAPAAQ